MPARRQPFPVALPLVTSLYPGDISPLAHPAPRSSADGGGAIGGAPFVRVLVPAAGVDAATATAAAARSPGAGASVEGCIDAASSAGERSGGSSKIAGPPSRTEDFCCSMAMTGKKGSEGGGVCEEIVPSPAQNMAQQPILAKDTVRPAK